MAALEPWIRSRFIRGALDAALDVGQRLLDTFFDGDVALWRAIGLRHASVQELSRRLDEGGGGVPLKYAWTCLRIHEQARQLPDRIATSLTYTHHVELLPVKDVRDKRRLAATAHRERWSTRELRTHVRAATPTPTGRGRRRDTPLTTLQKALRKATKDLDPTQPDPTEVRDLSDREAHRLLRTLESTADTLQTLAETIRRLRDR